MRNLIYISVLLLATVFWSGCKTCITGTVYTPETSFEPSGPLEGAAVSVTYEGKSLGFDITDENGAFCIQGLPSGKTVKIGAEKIIHDQFIYYGDPTSHSLRGTTKDLFCQTGNCQAIPRITTRIVAN